MKSLQSGFKCSVTISLVRDNCITKFHMKYKAIKLHFFVCFEDRREFTLVMQRSRINKLVVLQELQIGTFKILLAALTQEFICVGVLSFFSFWKDSDNSKTQKNIAPSDMHSWNVKTFPVNSLNTTLHFSFIFNISYSYGSIKHKYWKHTNNFGRHHFTYCFITQSYKSR